MDGHREANRALWNAWTRINLASELYDVEAFAAGKSLLHLQCYFGMDTIQAAAACRSCSR